MKSYRINPVGGGSGLKVHVVDEAGGLRVVGIFQSLAHAEAWIANDRGTARGDRALEPSQA